jgi:membrane protease YdiL (CAAX protease family)
MIDPASPSAPWLLTAVLVLLVAVLVVRAVRKDRYEYRRFTRFRSTVRRQRMYRRWLIGSFLWFGGCSAGVLLLVGRHVPLFLADVDGMPVVAAARSAFRSTGAVGPVVVGVVSAALLVVLVLGVVLARGAGDGPGLAEVPSLGDIHALLPRNRAELRYGAALSVNAGVVEELLFRLALPVLLYGVTGSSVLAIASSLVVFGALHLYQGVAGVIGATIVGALLMTVFLASGSILLAIVVHALIDLRSLVLIPVVVGRVHRVPGRRIPPRSRRPGPAGGPGRTGRTPTTRPESP